MFPCPRTVEEMALLTSASREDLTRLVSIQELETKERAESNSVTFLMLRQASGAARQECGQSPTHRLRIFTEYNFI